MTDKEFFNPSNEFRGKPFWSWNGKLEEDELMCQMQILHKMGMGGFFMHSRVGLATEYLGEEWFRLTERCTEEAKKLGMEAWIYDEDRWPSGTAGGKVTQKKENRMRFIVMHIDEIIPKDAEIIAQFECDLEGLSFTNKKRIDIGQKKAIRIYCGLIYKNFLVVASIMDLRMPIL